MSIRSRDNQTTGFDEFVGFRPALRRFLRVLSENNERSWFDEHRQRFESDVRGPALAFVRAMAPRLEAISPHMLADDRRSGGSLLRMHRDTRFTADKRPYHSHVIIRFPHALADAGTAPAYAVRIAPRSVSIWVGLRAPGTHSLRCIRERINRRRKEWATARGDAPFVAFFGDLLPPQLKRVPSGYPSDHPFEEDLRRKDFRAACSVRLSDAASADFVEEVEAAFVAAAPLMQFLCRALGLPFSARDRASTPA